MKQYVMVLGIFGSSMYAGNPGNYIEEPESSQLANPRAIYHDLWAKYIKIKTIASAPIMPAPGEYGYSQSERILLIRAQAVDILHLALLLSKNRRENRDHRVGRREISELRALVTPYRRYPCRIQPLPNILEYDSQPEDDDNGGDVSWDATL